MRLIDTRHEQTAVFAAEGWSKLTRRLGTAMVTAGPGVTNSVSAIAGAHLAGSPLLVIGGRAPAARWGSGSLQELDHVPVVAGLCRSAATATSAATVPVEIERAAAAALTAHRGPAFLDLPLDVLFSTNGDAALPEVVEPPRREPDPDDVERVAALLLGAERPVLLAGSDLYFDHGEAALVRCAEALGLPVFTSGLGRGCIPAGHPHALARSRGQALDEADLVVAAGVPLDFRLRFGELGRPVVHLCDSPGQVARHVPLRGGGGGRPRADPRRGGARPRSAAARGPTARAGWAGCATRRRRCAPARPTSSRRRRRRSARAGSTASSAAGSIATRW